MIGTTLGHYRITAKIGEGGMGVVYRAHDERLDRDVAIKVLPEAVAEDPQRLARFEREAKLLASLSHQNVATLYGLEVHEGQRFLVMELAEGETLAERIEKGPIPVDDALEFARQIAEGLEAAHEQGVIHRDLKPANVMVSPEGKVKVLDFGLAKAWHHNESDADLTHSPTLTGQMTAAGVLLGTAAYMSPEQARGKTVDKRADIWAFGVVLYEMIAGTRAFAGDTTSDILATIIKDDPDWDALPVGTPIPIRRLLRRCLTKDPRDRLHDIADARIELQFLSIDGNQLDEAAASVPSRAAWRTWLPWVFAILFAALAVAFLAAFLRSPPPGTVTKLLVGVEPAEWLGSSGSENRWKQEYRRLSRTAIALSPDGRYLVYSAGNDDGSRLYLREMSEAQATPITGSEGGVGPFFSPDAEWIGFWADDALKKVRVDGGPPMVVCAAPRVIRGASWGPGNDIFFGQSSGGVLRVSAGGGKPQEITFLGEGERAHYHPQILDDGETLLFTIIGMGGWDDTRIVAQRLNAGERKVLVKNGADPRYSPTGHLVFARLGSLVAAPFDQKRLEVTGGAGVVLESIRQGVNAANSAGNTYSGQFTFSASGSLVHVPGGVWPDDQFSLLWVDRAGRAEPLRIPPATYIGPRLSPDGGRLVVWAGGFEPDCIWVYDIARGTLSRLTFEETNDHWPLWTPDGSRITFGSESVESGRQSIVSVRADGSGATEILLTHDSEFLDPASWSPDGQVLAFLQESEAGDRDIWMLPREGEPWPFIESPFSDGWPAFSPDGRWLAYASDQSGRDEVFVTPYPGPGPKIQVSSGGGNSPAWAPNGQELFFQTSRDSDGLRSMIVVDVSTQPTFSAGVAREVFRLDHERTVPIRNYDVTLDGQTFVMLRDDPRPGEPVTQMHVTLNWFEELKRLAPTD